MFKQIFSTFSLLFVIIFTPSLSPAQGWKPEEQILFSKLDPRFSGTLFDNSVNRLFSFWDYDGGGAGFSVRPHLGPTGFRTGPSTAEYLSMSSDDSGNTLIAYVGLSNKVYAGVIPAGSNFISKSQELGVTVGYTAGRVVDVHVTKNGLGAVIWLDNTGKPNVAFRGSGPNAEFDLVNKAVLDTSPSSSAGSVFIARDINGGAFAVWRRDSQYKQAYFNPQNNTFDVQVFTPVLPVGEPPTPGKVNSGSMFDFTLNKNSSGDSVLAYSIYTSVKNQSVQPFNSISVVYAYRKRGTPVFGAQVFTKNPDDIEELYTQAAVMPDGRAVVSWLKKQLIPNPCTSGISGPYISDNQEFRSVISDTNGENWEALYSHGVDSKTTFIQFPTRIGVSNGRVIFAFKKSIKPGQCIPNQSSTEFNLVNAKWDSGAAFASVGSLTTVPGLNGIGGAQPLFDDIASIAVSDIGTVALLAARDVPGSFDSSPSLFIWESGAAPGSNPGTNTGQPTPTSNDACPNDINKSSAGVCGCGFEEIDSNGDAVIDCGSPGSIYTKGAVLSNAPKVEVKGKNLSLIMQIYEQIISGAVPRKGSGGKGGKAPKITAFYEVTAKLKDSKAKCGKIKVESKKNTVQLKNLLNGTYDVSYRMIFKEGQKKVGTTTQSPIANGTVTEGKTKCPAPKPKKK